MRQIVYLARLLIVLLVLAPLGLPAVAGATPRAPSPANPLGPVMVAQEAADLTITALNCPAGVVPDVAATELELLGEEALFGLGCGPAEGVLFDVRVDQQRLLDDAPTVNGLLAVEDLAPEARVVVRETVPPGYVPLSRRVQTATVGNEPLAFLFVNEEVTAGATADLTIVKLNCPPGFGAANLADDEELAEAVVAGQADLAGLGCELADGVPFAVDGLDVGETVGGLLVVADLPAGAQVTVTEIVPAGFEAVDPEQTVTVGPGATALFVDVVAETPPPVVADLTIVKLNCGTDVDPQTVDVAGLAGGEATVLPPDCELAEGVSFAVAGQDAGSTVGGLLTVEDLPVGSQATVTETVPPGFEAQSPEQVVTIPEGGVAVLFVNVAIAEETADLLIVKLNCAEAVDVETVDVAAVVEAGLATDVLDAGCEPAEGVPFAVNGEPVGTTENGLLSIEGFAVGTEVTVTETVPTGFSALDPEQTVTLEAGDNAVLFVNVPAAPEVADLTVIKLNCAEEIDPTAITPATVLADELPAGCDLAGGVGFAATNATGAEVGSGTTEDGLLVFEGLPSGTAVTVTETVPRFFRALDGEQTATIGEDESLLFVDVRGRGQVEAVKFFCGDQDRVDETDFFVAEAEVERCRQAVAGEVTFALSGPAGELGRVESDGDGIVRFDVPAGPDYVLTEITPDQDDTNPASDAFAVETDETVAINVIDYVPVTGDILVAKLVCADLFGTTIEVARFGVPEGEELGELGCVHEAAALVIYPYGDRQAEPIALETEEDGITYLSDIPVTTDETGPHLLVELGSGAEEIFTVGPGELTVIEVVNAIAPPVGTVLVAKQLCTDATVADVEIVGPVTDDVSAVPAPDAGCDLAAAEFALYPYGNLETQPIRFETELGAPALLPAVPITTDETQPHVLVEEVTGLEVRFAVEAGAVTLIEITNPEDDG